MFGVARDSPAGATSSVVRMLAGGLSGCRSTQPVTLSAPVILAHASRATSGRHSTAARELANEVPMAMSPYGLQQ